MPTTPTPDELPPTLVPTDQPAVPALPQEPIADAGGLPLPDAAPAVTSPDLPLNLDDFMGIVAEPAAAPLQAGKTKPSAIRLIAETALRSALSRTVLRQLRRQQPVVVILQVPSPAWVGPVRRAVEALANGRVEIMQATTRPKPARNNRDDGDEDAIQLIAMGRPVIGIAPSPDYLPRVLTTAADHSVALPAPDPVLMRRVLSRWCGTAKPVFLQHEDLAGLDLFDLAAALRCHRTTTPRACVKRLRRASRLKVRPPEADRAPPLQALSGYGEVKAWALALKADIALVKAGRLNAAELEGAVFLGPPGTGKTLLARSIASEAGVPFVSTSVGGWFGTEGYLNNIIQEIDRFCDALLLAMRSGAPTAIGFLDELDALPSRARLGPRNADFWTPIITHCLMRWEQLRRAGIILIGATNHAEAIDPALLRPGRFDRQFAILPPDEAGRRGILRMHLGSDLAGADLTLAARLSGGATGAVLAGHVKAARRRARTAGRPLHLEDLIREIAPADDRRPDEIRTIALHEAGHAVCAHRLGLVVAQVSTLASGEAAGATRLRLPGGVPDRAHLERQALTVLAGRAADVALGDGPNAGAVQDLLEATRLVASLHGAYGLGGSLAHRVAPGEAERLLQWDAGLSGVVEAELQHLMRQAEALVWANRDAIRAVAAALLARRVLTGEEVAALVADHPPRLRIRAGRAVRCGT